MPPLVTAREMRELDRLTIEELGLPGVVLMENAGRALAEDVAEGLPEGARVAILCGAGNNGGDGYVCARWLREWGHDARVYLCAGRPRPGGDAAIHLGVYERMGGMVVDVPDAEALARVEGEIRAAAVVVDALLGTGLSKEVTGHLAEVIAVVNAVPGVRVSADVPSGLDADRGRVLGVCVEAHRTVTFGFAKVGLVTSPGFEHAGVVRVVDIGIPRALLSRVGASLTLLDDPTVREKLPRRPATGHKGTFGHALVIAGSAGKVGAALLCAEGALRGGAGLVTVAAPPEVRPVVEQRILEAMSAELDYEAPLEDSLRALDRLAAGKAAIAWGPGMPTSEAARAVLFAALARLSLPIVLDADALNHVAVEPSVVRSARSPVVLTPHPGEAARLLGRATPDVQSDRLGSARQLAADSGAVVVLKGARTVVAAPDGRAALNPTGNPGMATGGTGDVLCGLIAALLAQGLDAFDAACVGAYVHGRAGDLARARRGERGMTAGDVVQHLPDAFQDLGGNVGTRSVIEGERGMKTRSS